MGVLGVELWGTGARVMRRSWHSLEGSEREGERNGVGGGGKGEEGRSEAADVVGGGVHRGQRRETGTV